MDSTNASSAPPKTICSKEAEEALLGYFLIEPEKILEINLAPIDFYFHKNQFIWKALLFLAESGTHIDNITLADELDKREELLEVGGSSYILQLIDQSSPLNYPYDYAKIIKDYSIKRRVLSIANKLARCAYSSDGHKDLNQSILELQELGVVQEGLSLDNWQAFTLKDAYQERPPIEYIVTNLLPIPSLSIVYGAPGTFKTFLLEDLAICVAAGREWLPPAPWIEENQVQSIKTNKSSVMWLDFDNGQRKTHERIAALARARDLSQETPIYYYSMPNPWLDATNKANINALSTRIKDKNCKLVVIDNLGVVSGGADENSAEMIQVMSNFRAISEETQVAIILIHHQRKNNGIGKRAGETLRGHSSIEAALDLALLVEREEQSNDISIRSTKTRGIDVPPFTATFTYENSSIGELMTAKFFGTSIMDKLSNRAIEREIKTILIGVSMNKTDLKKNVKANLEKVGINRISNVIDRMASTGELRSTPGTRPTERNYSLP